MLFLRRSGFTLLELIVAVVLTAVLAVSVATVLRSVLRERRTNPGDAGVTSQFRTSLRRDLNNARYYRLIEGGIQLRGPIAIDARTNQSLLVEAEVTWSLRPTQLGNLLTRRQSITGNSEMPNAQTIQPAWLGVAELAFSTTYIGADSTMPITQNLENDAVVGGWKVLPPSFQLDLLGTTGRKLTSESIARLRQ